MLGETICHVRTASINVVRQIVSGNRNSLKGITVYLKATAVNATVELNISFEDSVTIQTITTTITTELQLLLTTMLKAHKGLIINIKSGRLVIGNITFFRLFPAANRIYVSRIRKKNLS